MGPALRLIGPLSIAPTITLIGLSLFGEAGRKSGGHWVIACLTVALIVLFSQYLRDVAVPVPGFVGGRCRVVSNQGGLPGRNHEAREQGANALPLLGRAAAVLVMFTARGLPAASSPWRPPVEARGSEGVLNNDATLLFTCRLRHSQWGAPTLGAASALGMLCGVVASALESVGDYAACAQLARAPPTPSHAVSRDLAVEGLGCLLAGLLGTGNGTTSFSQNIAALGITRVGSRLVLQVSGVILVLMGIFGKCGAVFITIPEPIIGGMFLGTFGMIAAVGISTLQYADMNSSRNVFIVGLSIFSGLAIPAWLKENPGAINTSRDPLLTGAAHAARRERVCRSFLRRLALPACRSPRFFVHSSGFVLCVDRGRPAASGVSGPCSVAGKVAPIDQTLTVLCTMSKFVGGFLGFVLDNTVPGTVEERGLLAWRSHGRGDPHGAQGGGEAATRVYDLPLVAPLLRKWTWPRRVPVCPTFGQRPAGAQVAVGTNCAM
ncbi:unnamed protein product [Lampetra fluviatilis]